MDSNFDKKKVTSHNKEALLHEYDKRFDYELNSIQRRWMMLSVYIVVCGFSLSIFQNVAFKPILALFNVLAGVCSIGYYTQVRSRAYTNSLRLKEVADALGIVGIAHVQRKERLFRFKGVSFYVIMFMITLTLVWCIILLILLFNFDIF
jgi:hypothetical protein